MGGGCSLVRREPALASADHSHSATPCPAGPCSSSFSIASSTTAGSRQVGGAWKGPKPPRPVYAEVGAYAEHSSGPPRSRGVGVGLSALGPRRPCGGRGEPRGAREQLRYETDPVLLRLCEQLVQRHHRLWQLLQVLTGGPSGGGRRAVGPGPGVEGLQLAGGVVWPLEPRCCGRSGRGHVAGGGARAGGGASPSARLSGPPPGCSTRRG